MRNGITRTAVWPSGAEAEGEDSCILSLGLVFYRPFTVVCM